MEKIVNRKPFQGVFNIIRFNWHFYAIAFTLFFTTYLLPWDYPLLYTILRCLILVPMLISLMVSYYIYDCSGFYSFDWLRKLNLAAPQNIININAGFDETSAIIKNEFPNANLIVLDFYNPEKHTEVSIKRARKSYPPYPGTQAIDLQKTPFKYHPVDCIFLVFAAHEIRNTDERILFFKELNRNLNPEGVIILVEHLRDFQNFMAFNIGFFHFYSEKNWEHIIEAAGLEIQLTKKLTPFTSLFIIGKNGITS